MYHQTSIKWTVVEYVLGSLILFILATVQAHLLEQDARGSDCKNEISNIVEATGKLGADLLKIMSDSNNNGSIFISPISIQISLHIIMQGADNDSETYWEMEKYFDYDVRIKKRETIHEAMAKLIVSLDLESRKGRYVYDGERNTKWWKQPTKFNIANIFITEKQIANGLRKDFQNSVNKYYDIVFHTFDRSETNFFSNLFSKVNHWISSKTEHTIQLGLDSSDLMNSIAIIINAAYLRGEWLYPFCESNTKQDTFYRNGIKTDNITVPFMSRARFYSYLDLRQSTEKTVQEIDREKGHLDYHLDCQVVSLPIDEDGLSMLILLPDKLDGLSKLYNVRVSRIMEQMRHSGDAKKINFKLPKFSLDVEYNMKHYLRQLGLRRLSYSPELHKMFELSDIDFDCITHKARINVTGMGIGVSAIAGMKIQPASNEENEKAKPIHFVADHPFMYAVVHNYKHPVPLFMGQVVTF